VKLLTFSIEIDLERLVDNLFKHCKFFKKSILSITNTSGKTTQSLKDKFFYVDF
jgi:hypothetical protein